MEKYLEKYANEQKALKTVVHCREKFCRKGKVLFSMTQL